MFIDIIKLLESIKEACDKQTSCKDCPFAKYYDNGHAIYCCLNDTPDRWQIDSTFDAEVLCDVSDFERSYMVEV